MSEPFIAEVRIFAGNFAPSGFAFCNGQLLPIAQNTALFSLIGTTFGGDGETTMGLPDLQGRAPLHPGSGPGLTPRRWGEKIGQAAATLTAAQLPPHNHFVKAAPNQAPLKTPGPDRSLARSRFASAYQQDTTNNLVALDNQVLTDTGGDQAHNNRQPYLGLNFIIALIGAYPSYN